MYLRWDLQNVILLCAFCHNEKWHKLSLGRKWFDVTYPRKELNIRKNDSILQLKRLFMEEKLKELEQMRIKVGKSNFALVDKEDYSELSKYTWVLFQGYTGREVVVSKNL